jgi:Na+/H+ antiporter NhaD/arsenite permease-like protein
MSPAILALLALLVTLVLSVTTHINVGLVAIGLAWLVGVYAAHLKPELVVNGFPSVLFITLTGVTLLFAVAKANGTLALLAGRAARLVRGRAALLPILFFALAFVLSAIGPGAIASVALVAPLAMATGIRARIPNLLTAVMVGTGANAGNLSPISTVGAVVNAIMTRMGLAGNEWRIFAAMFAAHLAAAMGAYLLFGGWRLLRERAVVAVETSAAEPLKRAHWLTIAITMIWIVSVVVFRAHVGLSAFTAATALILLRVSDERETIRGIPLDVILMVCGVSMMIAVLEATGGLEMFTSLLARLATPATINAVIAFVTGLVSTYSSTVGVVLPTFLPMIPSLVRQVGGGDPVAVAISINVGSALVDVSPLSTLGALCLAAVADRDQARVLFRQLLIWGLSMSVVGAVLCLLLAPAFARL